MFTYEDHIKLALSQHVIILFLCFCGIVLNSAMLGIFCTKKQVRGSIYTTYMIQIAATDLIVCIVWLVMTSLFLHELSTNKKADEPPTEFKDISGIESPLTLYRFIYTVYNFHYYINIFLLATMSVERCVAVWKSLRCQRYQFNRKFIYGISLLMWLVAFACALPSFLKLDLVTENLNLTSNSSNEQSHRYMRCYDPLKFASDNNFTFVIDHNGVSVVDCYNMMEKDYMTLLDDMQEAYGDAEYTELYSYDDYEDMPNITVQLPQHIFHIRSPFGGNTTAVDYKVYYSLFHGIVPHIHAKSKLNPLDDVCDPNLSAAAMIYNISVNLVIGFFLPFVLILVSYVSIAYMIRMRALDRMDDGDVIESESTLGRRMSDFLRQFVNGGNSLKNGGESTPPYNKGSSPLLRRSMRNKARERGLGVGGETPSDIKSSRDNILKNPIVKTRSNENPPKPAAGEVRPRLSSFPNPSHSRRISGGSASSGESFQTDQTSLQGTTPSPGVRLSPPTFMQENKTQHGESPQQTQRWSSEGYPNPTDDKTSARIVEDSEPIYDRADDITMNKPPSGDSTLELHGSYARLYAQKHDPRRFQRQMSTTSNYRSRAYSAASRASGGGGGVGRKTIVHKNAERHLRISRTVLTYVCVFAVCWLPQRTVAVVYVLKGMVGLGGYACHTIFTTTRILSFLSVLLNPAVYAMTQREIRHLIRRKLALLCKCVQPGREIPPGPLNPEPNGSNRRDFSAVAEHNITTDEEWGRRERHARNKERWSRMMQRLGGKNLRLSLTGSGFTSRADKQSDGTIDEDEEKGQSSKGQSSSTSMKLIGGWEDWKQLIDMAENSKKQPQAEETIL